MRYLVIFLLSLGFAGCASMAREGAADPYAQPRYGMTKQQMLESMGRPQAIEIYKKSAQSRVEYYIYTRYYPSSQIKIPVCLVNNRVVGWGKTFYEDHVSPDDQRIK